MTDIQKYFTLPDGAKLAYDLHGGKHLNKKGAIPLILIGGVSTTKVDWARLIPELSKTRAVLTFDHRGIGLSTNSNSVNGDELSIESTACDLSALIQSFGWQQVDILGISMGGVILQQLLLFHRHPTTPRELPFRVHRAILSATFASPLEDISDFQRERFDQALTDEQKKALARPFLEASLGPKWLALPENQERFDVWLNNSIINRPYRTIIRQRKMITQFSFVDSLKYIEPSTQILVIHGLDDVIAPFFNAEEILRACPQSRLVSIGSRRGQVPSYAFGHLWHEYFDVNVWVGVLESFLDDESVVVEARL